jgi:hypothetical protein
MQKRVYRTADVLVTVCIVVVALATVVTFFRNSRQISESKRPTVQPGEEISLPLVEWAKYSKTVVLAVRSNCHFCTESLPFYEQLLEKLSNNGLTHVVAVAPDSPAVTASYLSDHGVRVASVKQYSFSKLKIDGTPTLLIVNPQGKVDKVWVGKLNPSGECDVLRNLGLAGERDQSTTSSSTRVGPGSWRLLRSDALSFSPLWKDAKPRKHAPRVSPPTAKTRTNKHP